MAKAADNCNLCASYGGWLDETHYICAAKLKIYHRAAMDTGTCSLYLEEATLDAILGVRCTKIQKKQRKR